MTKLMQEALGLNNFTICNDDMDLLELFKEYEIITDLKRDNWSKGDDYLVAMLDDNDDELFFLYVDYHNLEICKYVEDIDLKDIEYLYQNTEITKEQILEFSDNFIICDDDSVIDIDDYEEIFSKWSKIYQGHDTVYYSREKENFFVDGVKNGNDGVWEDVSEAFEYIYGDIVLGNDSDIGNKTFNINEEDYFEFDFDSLLVQSIDDEPKLIAKVPMHGAYNNEYFVMDVNNKKTYAITECHECDERNKEKVENIELSFNVAYVGSASGEIFWVKKEIVTQRLGDYDFEEFIKEDWGDDKEWSDFGFATENENYIIATKDNFLDIEDFNTICLEEDLI